MRQTALSVTLVLLLCGGPICACSSSSVNADAGHADEPSGGKLDQDHDAAPASDQRTASSPTLQATSCPLSSLCDGSFKQNMLVLHPNVEYLQGRYPTGFSRSNLAALISVESDRPSAPAYWAMGNHWSSYPLIGHAREVADPRYEDGFYLVREPWTAALSAYRDPSVGGLAYQALRIAAEKSQATLTDAELQADLGKLPIFSSPTHLFIFNPEDRWPDTYGSVTLAYSTHAEYFGQTPATEMAAYLQNSNNSDAAKRSYLQQRLIRNEDGLDDFITGGAACVVDDHSLDPSQPTHYCKWPHFGMQQSFEVPLPLRNGFVFGTRARVLSYHGQGAVNRHLSRYGLSANHLHLNVRLQIRRERSPGNRPAYFDARSGTTKVKQYDRIAVMVPIVEPEELCLNQTLQASEQLCDEVDIGYVDASTVLHRPDIGTGQFMYRIGRKGVSLSMAGGGSTTRKLQRFAAGEWLTFEVTDFPDFKAEMTRAAQACQQHHGEWGIPQAFCDIESLDWRDYEIAALSFGSEVRGAHSLIVQFSHMTLKQP